MDAKYRDNAQYKVWDYWFHNSIFYLLVLNLDNNILYLIEGTENDDC